MKMAGASNNTSKSVEAMTKHIQKRSLDVKFDLEGTKYNPIENIGIGAYGVVCSAIHKKSKDKVAIKKIPNVFDVLVIAKRTHREIKILKHFKHDNIISIREILKPKEDYKDFRDIYVVFDLMESDLHKIIYSDQELSEEHSRYFLYQILRGLKYIHSANVVHRDLKPGNILVNEDCHVRVGDFGMSRGIFASPNEPSHFMTQYVATRWYRAPEILLSLVEYGTAVDMWSVGCIFAEMLGRKHLFPGKDYISQIKLIIGVLGSPSAQVFTKCQNEVIKKILVTIGPKEAIPWKTLFPKASKKAIDLLSKMLVINPKERITVVDALKHPYLQKYHDPDDEPICVPAFNFDFEKEFMDKEKLRDVIYTEIMEFHKPRTPTLSFSAFIRPAPNKDIKLEGNLVRIPENSGTIKVEKSSPLTESNCKLPDIKTSPVSVNTNNLLTLSANDVEMLSAKSNDGKMETQSCVPLVDKENKAQTDSKTISDDTKALIKKALLNSQWRQRHDSTGDKDEKPKVITAAMRQKERQDKRREKEKNKKLRNKKKEAKAQKEEVFLSEADKAMLKRWAEMKHKNEKTILPKPEASSMIQTTTGATVPQNNLPATAITTPPQVVHVNSNGSPPDLLQGKSSNIGQNITVSQGVSHGGIFISNFNTAGSVAPQAVVLPDVFPANNLNQPTPSFPQPNQFPHPQQPSNTNQTSIIQSVSQNNFTDSSFNTSGQSDLSFTDSSFNTSGNQSTLSFESNTSFGSLNAEGIDLVSLSKDLQSSIKCTLPSSQASFTSTQGGFQYQQDQHGASYRPQMDVMNSEPRGTNIQPTNLNFPSQSFDQNMVISSQAMSQQPSGFTQSTAFPPQQQYSHSVPSQPPGFHQTETTQYSSDITNQTQQKTTPDLLNFTPTSDYGISPPKAFQHDSPSFYNQMQMNQQGSSNSNTQQQGASASGEPVWNTSSVVSSTSPGYIANSPGLKVDCSSPERKPSNQTNSQLQPDLIALLSKQMSKSLLDNIMPPSLSLTPRGTGAGYGVGMDMDALLVQAQATSDSGTQSPLSSSLLADWLEVTGGNLIADIHDLEQEMSTQSPLPFHDL